MSKMRILLTGGGGMVGRNLLEHPSIDKFKILAPRRGDLDLRDFMAVVDYLNTHRPDMVIHAAGKVGGIQANMRDPVGFLLENLDMGRNVVLASRQVGITRLLNLGSSCMYPRNHSKPLSEDLVMQGGLEPTNEGYALAKVVTARLCEYIARENSKFQYKTLIPCNLYGRYDKFDPAHSHLIPAIIHKIHQAKIEGKELVEIWGDGTARREFMYAGDLADAVVRAINDFENIPFLMNIGVGQDYSINEYYESAARIMDFTGGFVHDLGRPVGMARKLVDIGRQRSWGWSPKHDLDSGIRLAYAFFLETK